MPRHLVGTLAQCVAWKTALDIAAGCPIRGVTIGGPERVHPTIVGPGWTTTVSWDVISINPDLATLEFPDDQLPRLGAGGLPAAALTKGEADLHPALRSAVRVRHSSSDTSASVRIMCLGDSITVGYTNNSAWTVPFAYGYRLSLYTMLEDVYPGKCIYVGLSPEPRNGVYGDPDASGRSSFALTEIGHDNHRGYGGQGTGFVLPRISSWMSQDAPDVVLLMIGINDITAGSTGEPSTVESTLQSIVTAIYTANSLAHVIVAQIFEPSTPTPAIISYNTFIRDTMVPTFIAQGRSIATVDQRAALLNGAPATSAELFSNGINHPWSDGYTRMAAAWFTELVPFLASRT